MAFLARLFGRSAPKPPAPAAPPEPPPALGTVVIPEDLATRLAAGGAELGDTVAAILREHVAAGDAAAARALEEPPGEGERVPFWLARDPGEADGIEEALRERLERRRAAEAEGADAAGDDPGSARRSRRRTPGPPPPA